MIRTSFFLIFFLTQIGANTALLPGKYISGECDILFNIKQTNGGFKYQLISDKKLNFFNLLLEHGYIIFDNLYSHFYDTLENRTFPTGTKAYKVEGMLIDDNNFVIQNYGNAMNPYIVFDSCNNSKYLHYQLLNLNKIEQKIKNNENFLENFYEKLMQHIPITPKTLTQYNNIAYYLQQAGANEEAVYLLEKIIKKFPKRTVAYINLGDAYWELGEKAKARKAYTTYIEQMCAKGLEKKIPKKVLERVKSRK